MKSNRESSDLDLAQRGRRAFQQLHLPECQEEREGRLGSLILVDAVFLKAIAAAAALGVVEIESQVVAAQEPLEREPGLLEPGELLGGMVGLDAGRDGREGLDRLLVELGAVAVAAVEA